MREIIEHIEKQGGEAVAILPDSTTEDPNTHSWVLWSTSLGDSRWYHTHLVQHAHVPYLLYGNYHLPTLKAGLRDLYRRAGLPLDGIVAALDGQEWSPDTLDEIARLLEKAGYEIRESY
jgi:hypothetical protein